MNRRSRGLSTPTLVIIIVVVLAVAGVGSYYLIVTTTMTNSVPLTPVKIGVESSMSYGWWYVGVQKGFFQRLGINATLTSYQGDAALIAAVSSGQSDISAASPMLIANAINAGKKITIIGAMQTGLPQGADMVARIDSPITNINQLAGKKVGISAKGTTTDLLAQMVMRKANMTFTEVPLAQGVPALLSGQVDAMVSQDPQSYQVISARQGRVVADLSAMFSNLWNPYSVVLASDSIIQSHPDVVKKVLQGLYNTMAYMQSNPKTVVPMLADFTASPVDVTSRLYNDTFPVMSLDGTVDTTALIQNINLQKSLSGDKTGTPALSVLYTGQFVPVKANANG